MFNTFESTEPKKRRQQKELHTIVIQIRSTVATEMYTIKVDSRRLLKDLYDIIMAKSQREIRYIFYPITIRDPSSLITEGHKLMFKNNELQLSDTQDIETLTIADYFNITKKQLEELGYTLSLIISYKGQPMNQMSCKESPQANGRL